MPDLHRIEGELLGFYSKPQYSSLFYQRNRFEMAAKTITPQALAKTAAETLLRSQSLLDPVYVEELRGSVELYRAFDGISKEQGTAMTLGASWSSRDLVERIWQATAKLSGAGREELFMDLMRSANFIHPAWNQMIHIARMQVPQGNCVVVIRGRGNWKAMQTNRPKARRSPYPPKPFDELKNPQVESVDDVLYSLRMMPIPGEEQYVVPLFNDMWVRKVAKNLRWPLA
jgi:hypothetical protein